jgi:HNH endonuclease.
MKTWREKNADQIKRKGEEYRKTHREERREYNRQWRQKHGDYWRSYQNERLRTDLNYRLHNYISAAIRKAIRKNHRSTFNILGYSTDDLRHHLETLFQPGMSWQNYGTEWHIDHVIPKSWFRIENEDGIDEYELKVCWSLRNLQPLSASENLKKKDRHISHLELGELHITYEQFRIKIEHHKRDQTAFAL